MGAFSAVCFAGAGEVLVGFSVAVVVFSVADLNVLCGIVLAFAPLALGADFDAFSAVCGAWLLEAVVDFSVAIVIDVIADFRTWFVGCGAGAPFAFFALLCAGGAKAFAGAGEVFVDVAVTVVVFSVAFFGLSGGGGDGLIEGIAELCEVVGLEIGLGPACFGDFVEKPGVDVVEGCVAVATDVVGRGWCDFSKADDKGLDIVFDT